jgi:2-polyprenyl-6-methoxyphenol hydroxylase-like FAD-dependent oxidoreductase
MAPRIGIVGGGPSGLAAGLACSKVGLDAVVFERAPDFRRVGAGVLIHSNGQKGLEVLGLLHEFLEIVAPVGRLILERPDGKQLAAIEYESLGVDHPRAAVVIRHDLQELLLGACSQAGVPVAFGRKAVGFRNDGGGVIQFEGGEEDRFDIVLGCDGTGSGLRSAAGLPAKVRRTGTAYLRGIADRESPDASVREVWGPRGRRYGFAPLPNKQTYFYCTLPPGSWEATREKNLQPWIESWADCGARAVDLFRHVRDWESVNYDEVKEVKARHWSAPPLFLLGDAAHGMTPDIGQGTNGAVVDAILLARLLASWRDGARTLEGVAQEYERVRRRFVRKQQKVSRRVAKIAGWSSAPARVLRNTLLPLIRATAIDVAAGVNPLENPYMTPFP